MCGYYMRIITAIIGPFLISFYLNKTEYTYEIHYNTNIRAKFIVVFVPLEINIYGTMSLARAI